MALRSGPFNGLENAWDAYDWANYFRQFISNGVFPNPSHNLQVVEHNNMQTKIKVGVGFIEGHKILNKTELIMQHDIADGVLKRIDRIVMRVNFLLNKEEFIIKKGVFASNPVAPTLVRNTEYYELALADILITNGATQITQANITDTRLNSNLCGIVHAIVDQVDTTEIFNQYQSWFNSFSVEKQQEFEKWIEDLNTLLDGDVATNLLNKILQVDDKIGILTEDVNAHLGDNVYLTLNGTNALIGTHENVTEYKTGMLLAFKNTTQNTGAVTININSLGAKSLLKSNGTALSSGNLKVNGVYQARYDGSNFFLLGEGGEYGTAIASDVRVGKTFGTEDGLKDGTYLAYGVDEEIPIDNLNAQPTYVSMPLVNRFGNYASVQYNRDALRFDYKNKVIVGVNSNTYTKYNASTGAYMSTLSTLQNVGYYNALDPEHGVMYIDATGSGMNPSKRDANFVELWKTNETIFSGLHNLVAHVPEDGGVVGFESSNSRGFKYNGQGALMWRTSGYLGGGASVAVAKNGDVYLATTEAISSSRVQRLYKFSSANGASSVITLNNLINDNVMRLRIDDTNNRIILLFKSSGIQVRNLNMGLMYSTNSAYITGAFNMEVDKQGNIYVTSREDTAGAGITKLTPTLTVLWKSLRDVDNTAGAIDVDKNPSVMYPDVFHAGQSYNIVRSKQTINLK